MPKPKHVPQANDKKTGKFVHVFNRDEIVERLAEDLSKGVTIQKALRQPGMPSHVALCDWRKEDPRIAAKFYDALVMGFDYIAEECMEIADKPAASLADVQNRRLQIDTRLRLLSKWYPKKYGDRIAIDGEVTVKISPLEQLRRLENRAANRVVIDEATGREVNSQTTHGSGASPAGHLETIIPEMVTKAWVRKTRQDAAESEQSEEDEVESIMAERAEWARQQLLDQPEASEEDCF